MSWLFQHLVDQETKYTFHQSVFLLSFIINFHYFKQLFCFCFLGKHAYEVCKSNVNEILLVSDEEIVAAVKALYNHGLVVEPSGAAAFAAFMFKKIPNVSNKNLVIVLTGSNITAEEMKALLTEKC